MEFFQKCPFRPISRCCPGYILPRTDSILKTLSLQGLDLFSPQVTLSLPCSEQNQGAPVGPMAGEGERPRPAGTSRLLADRPVGRWGTAAPPCACPPLSSKERSFSTLQ